MAAVTADLSTPDGARYVIDTAIAEIGGVDILVNNVGAGDADRLKLGGFLDADDNQWRDLFDLNLFSAVWASRAALPSLIDRRGVIVNVASINARVPATGPVGYSEAKAALVAFGKRLSEEFGPQGVRVNTVSPGPVGTGLWRDPEGFGAKVAASFGANHADFIAAMPETFGIASGRIAEPEEVAALITFLAFPTARSVLGADIVIDGGLVKTT
ncbi:SDR family oxidoreductase [Pseudonocardia eucalypti]|uniref:SDR family oxidoreductase n=1 Tax=Pseudonocardia eucalypti TaxID=648755 RepID=A0ABP9QHK7_9PSEU|nr:NAD(P)-dependent dehydrogenase (short-subunit alcohol dehydrogenase family) [Pseudonocardia eucalypti]